MSFKALKTKPKKLQFSLPHLGEKGQVEIRTVIIVRSDGGQINR